MHAKVRRESVAGYATDETLACGPKGHTRWWMTLARSIVSVDFELLLVIYKGPIR